MPSAQYAEYNMRSVLNLIQCPRNFQTEPMYTPTYDSLQVDRYASSKDTQISSGAHDLYVKPDEGFIPFTLNQGHFEVEDTQHWIAYSGMSSSMSSSSFLV